MPPDDAPEPPAALVGRALRLLVALMLATTIVVMLLRGIALP